MLERAAEDNTIYLGVDGGGTKCSAVLTSADRRVLGVGLAGPANPFQNMSSAIDSIVEASKLAVQDAGLSQAELPNVVAGMGLAGVNLPTVHRAMSNWQHPFRNLFVTTDLEIACVGAHDGKDGAAVIVGTGSSGCVIKGGQTRIIGAHGFPHADIGGGAWIGLEAVRAALLHVDDLGPQTALTVSIEDALEAKGVNIVDALIGARPADYARLARLVFAAADSGDDVANNILDRATEYLGAVMRRLVELDPPRISAIGGLSTLMTGRLDGEIRDALSPPLNSPDIGAVLYAQRKNRDLIAAA